MTSRDGLRIALPTRSRTIRAAATGQLPARASNGTAAIWTTYPKIVMAQNCLVASPVACESCAPARPFSYLPRERTPMGKRNPYRPTASGGIEVSKIGRPPRPGKATTGRIPPRPAAAKSVPVKTARRRAW